MSRNSRRSRFTSLGASSLRCVTNHRWRAACSDDARHRVGQIFSGGGLFQDEWLPRWLTVPIADGSASGGGPAPTCSCLTIGRSRGAGRA
jgi:hypothetical protein